MSLPNGIFGTPVWTKGRNHNTSGRKEENRPQPFTIQSARIGYERAHFDRLVYGLYGLTPEDIAVVEGRKYESL